VRKKQLKAVAPTGKNNGMQARGQKKEDISGLDKNGAWGQTNK